MGLFDLGGVLEAWMPDEINQRQYSEGLQKQIDSSISGMDDFRSARDRYLSNYEGEIGRAVGKSRSLNDQTEREINSMVGGLSNANFLDDRDRVRSGDLAALGGLLGQLGGGMGRSNKIAASRLGYAGRPSGTYMDRQRSAFLGSFGAPIASQIFGGLNSAAAGAASERANNINQRMGLIGTRNELPFGLAEMQLRPLYARQQARGDEIDQLGGLSSVNRSNVAGFERKQNPWVGMAKAGDGMMNSAVDIGMSLGGSFLGGGAGGMLGGLLGGGMGGMGGMGGGGGMSGMFGGWGGQRSGNPYLPSNFGSLSGSDQAYYNWALRNNPYIGPSAITNPWE